MSDAPKLRDLQLGLRALIAGAPPRDAAARAARAAAIAALPIRGDSRLGAAERVQIYAGMYFARIRDAIAEDYGALATALGHERFDRLVRAYLAAHPPGDPSLRRAADALAGFVATASALVPEPWIAELARFEAALVSAFDAADEPVLTRAHLERLAPEDWPDLAIRPVRSLVLLETATAVEDARAALLRGDAPPRPAEAPAGRGLRVWRQDLRVYFRRTPRHEHALLRAAADGLPFAEICARLEDPRLEAGPDPAAAAVALLERWLEDALLLDTVGA